VITRYRLDELHLIIFVFVINRSIYYLLSIMSDTQLADQFLYQSSLKTDSSVRVSSRKRVLYVIDLNQGSYANGVITIDATSQLNGAEGFACLRDAYIMLPYKVSMKNSSGEVLGAAANRLSVGLKCGNWIVIDAMSLELNGKSILSMTEYKMFATNLRAQFETSPAYVEKHGSESFLYPDSSGSLTWSATAGGTGSGDGYTNTAADLTGKLVVSATGSGVESANEGFVKRLLANPPVANANTNGWPTIHLLLLILSLINLVAVLLKLEEAQSILLLEYGTIFSKLNLLICIRYLKSLI